MVTIGGRGPNPLYSLVQAQEVDAAAGDATTSAPAEVEAPAAPAVEDVLSFQV